MVSGKKGVETIGKKMQKNERYHCDQDEKRSPMGWVPSKGVRTTGKK
jgi:hypothetical protein